MLMATPPAARISAIVAAKRAAMERAGLVASEVCGVASVVTVSVVQRDLVAEAAQIPDHQPGAGQLAPQPRDVELDRIDADFLLVEREQLVEDPLLRHDAAAVQHQDLQHAELAAGELQRNTIDAGDPPSRVEQELAVF